MNDFTLPTNIKQIGTISDGLRIYVEDFVCTYLHQLAESGGYNERLAYLIGRHMTIDGQDFLFISGAVEGKYTETTDNLHRFSERSVTHAKEVIADYFPGMEIVGWMLSQPSFGVKVPVNYQSYHLRQFKDAHHVMFVTDPMDRVSAFYSAETSSVTPVMSPEERLGEVPGYFIYFDKNPAMHEYMLAQNGTDYSQPKPPTFLERPRMEYAEEENFDDDDYPAMVDASDDPDDRDSAIMRRRVHRVNQRKSVSETKRAMNLLASLSAVLFIVSFVMGVALVRNQDRIAQMELEMRALTTAYRNLFTQIGAAPAFMEQDVQVPLGENYGEGDVLTEPAAQITDPPAEAAIIPAPVPAPVLPATPLTHTIQPGDTLISISMNIFGDDTMVSAIMELNGIENPNHIVSGRTIALPPRS